MDNFFDKLGDLLKSTLGGESDDVFGRRSSSSAKAPRSDFQEAMDELDAFLNEGREGALGARPASGGSETRGTGREAPPRRPQAPSGPPPEIVADYRYLGLAYGAPFEEVRAAYKRLLKEYHPDKNAHDPEKLKKATEISQKINMAYQRIERYKETGSI